jgi:hypothetical protein
MTEKIFKKYLIILLIYTVIVRFIGFYGLRLYYTLADNPKLLPPTVQSFQAFVTAIEFALKVLVVILMLVDIKGKKLIDWLIILITFFNADIGIILFIVWSFYKEWTQKYEAQHKL